MSAKGKKTTTKGAEKPATAPARKERTGTKMLAAMAIVKDNPNQPRKVIIKLFMDKAKLTKAGASTYWSLIQKKLK